MSADAFLDSTTGHSSVQLAASRWRTQVLQLPRYANYHSGLHTCRISFLTNSALHNPWLVPALGVGDPAVCTNVALLQLLTGQRSHSQADPPLKFSNLEGDDINGHSAAIRSFKPAPQQPHRESEPVDPRDLAQRLEAYAVKLQRHAQSRPGRSPSPPPRKRPPSDTPSTASTRNDSPCFSPRRTDSHHLSRPNHTIPDALTGTVEVVKIEQKRAEAVHVSPPKPKARPNSDNPNLEVQFSGAVSRRTSHNRILSQVLDDVPALHEPCSDFDGCQASKTTEGAAIALAALTEKERLLERQQDREQGQALELESITDSSNLPDVGEGKKRATTATTGTTARATLIHSPEQAAFDIVQLKNPGEIKSVQVRRATLVPSGVQHSNNRCDGNLHTGKNIEHRSASHLKEVSRPSAPQRSPPASPLPVSVISANELAL